MFVESCHRGVVAGDLVSTLSTIVIDPPEGHLATYVQSLRRVLDHDDVDPRARPLARRSLLAGLLELEGEEAATREGTRWRCV